MTGRIVALNCGMYSVLADGIIYKVPARGSFRTKGIKPTVGDNVILDDDYLAIKEVLERHSYLKRPLIANADQLLIIQSLKEPDFSYDLVFKYLTYANMNHLVPKIVVTKIDKESDKQKLNEIKEVFETLEIEIHFLSNFTKEGVDEISHLFAGKITCLIGQTGAGKSSTINSIDPSFARIEGEYSKALGRGKHQTKEAVLLPYCGGFIADTPGFSSLELELYKEDAAIYFPGFYQRYTECYYTDCLHISEPKCAIKKAIDDVKIPKIAYECYKRLSNELIFRNRRYEK